MNEPSHTRWLSFQAADELTAACVQRICQIAAQAIAERGAFKIVLAGGSTPKAAYQLLAQGQQDWSRWHIYFGDERCQPIGHAERNDQMAKEAWLDHVPIPASQIHPIPSELGAEKGAERYALTIGSALPFDLVLLGLGEDGHTASLFPGQPLDPTAWTQAVHNAPKPPPERVSLGINALANSRQMIYLVSGSGKCDALKRWQASEAIPAALVSERHGSAEVMVMADCKS